MKVYVKDDLLGRFLRLYFIDEAGYDEIRIHRPQGGDVWQTDTVPAGADPDPSLVITREMARALVDALTEHTPTRVDEELLKTLELERARVDKMLDNLLERPILIGNNVQHVRGQR